ncbi:MAG: hypothetical protein M0P49_02665 [Bacilli bacterium]|nr:hypothetical protein [Bacilli bacterium]
MKFDIGCLLVTENMDTRRMIGEDNIEESFFNTTLSYIRESNNEFRECTKTFYKSLLESDSEFAINESFGSFFDKVKDIIARFLKFIKSLFDRFITGLNGAFKAQKHLVRHKSDFGKFSEKNEFSMDWFDFTFSTTVPIIEAERAFNSEFEDIAKRNVTDKKEMLKAIGEIYSNFVASIDIFYDKFRARVIGLEGSVMSSDYNNELFSTYRSGDSDTSQKTITLSDVLEAYTRFEGYTNHEKTIKATKGQIEKEYEQIKKKVSSMTTRNSDLDYQKFVQVFINPEFNDGQGVALDSDFVAKADLFIKAKTNQVIEMSNIHSLAFAAKLDAIKSCFNQDKTLLYKALYKIQGTIPKEEGGK